MSFSVVVVSKDPVDVVQRFVAYYLEQGADKITIFLDDPNSDLRHEFNHISAVETVPMTKEFRASLETDQDDAGPPQNSIGNYAYRRLEEDWMVRVDIDEFVYFPNQTIKEALDALPKSALVVRPDVAERINTDRADGRHYFRTEMQESDLPKVYGDRWKEWRAGHGFIGHTLSKAITRRGVKNVVYPTHGPVKIPFLSRFKHITAAMHKKLPFIERHEMPGAYLLHFNNEEFQKWYGKIVWRAKVFSFRHIPLVALMDRVIQAGQDKGVPVNEAFRAAHRDYFHFDEKRLQTLKDVNALVSLDIDFDQLVKKYFPKESL